MRQTPLTGEDALPGRWIPQGCSHFVNSPHCWAQIIKQVFLSSSENNLCLTIQLLVDYSWRVFSNFSTHNQFSISNSSRPYFLFSLIRLKTRWYSEGTFIECLQPTSEWSVLTVLSDLVSFSGKKCKSFSAFQILHSLLTRIFILQFVVLASTA